MQHSNTFNRSAVIALLWWLVGLSIDTTASPQTEGMVVVSLRAKVDVASHRVTVGDVAEVVGGTSTLREQIARIDLEEFGVGQSVTIKRRQVEFRLRLAELPKGSFQVVGEAEVVATAVRQHVSADAIVKAATAAAVKRFPWPADDLSVKLVQPITAVMPAVVDQDEARFQIEPHAQNAALGRTQMDVTVFVRGERKLSLPVYLDVRLIQRVAIARAAIAKGETIAESAVIVDRRPIDPGVKITPPELIIGRKTKRAIAPGVVLAEADLDVIPTASPFLVRARQPVKLIGKAGHFTIEARGEASQDGKLDDRIRAINTDSKKVVVGRVVGEGRIEIE